MTNNNIPEPERFDGINPPCHLFLDQLRIQFVLNPSRFPSENMKVMFMFALLRGPALEWASSAMASNSPILEDFELAVQALTAIFQKPDRSRTATDRIQELEQGENSVETYASAFTQLAHLVNWNEPALIAQFRQGLSDPIQDLLAPMDLPTKLLDIIALAIRLDLRITARQKVKSRAQGHSKARSLPVEDTAPPPAIPAQRSPTTAMEIDATRQGQPYRSSVPIKERPQPNDGFCFYCKKYGHLIAQCRRRPPREPLKEKGQSNQ
jgi:hypothetical protein